MRAAADGAEGVVSDCTERGTPRGAPITMAAPRPSAQQETPMRHTFMTTLARRYVVALAIAVTATWSGTAGADSLGITPAGEITATSLGIVEIFVTDIVRCNMTLELEVDETANKRLGEPFGQVTSAEADDCTKEEESADVTFLDLPWDITYEGIAGGLPSEIADILMNFEEIAMLVEYEVCEESLGCLYRGDLEGILPLFHIFMEEPYINQLLSVFQTLIPLERAELTVLECPPAAALMGEFELEPTQTIVDQ